MWSAVFWTFLSYSSIVLSAVLKTRSTNGENAFAGITPSKSLEWVPCFLDADATPFEAVECARLIAPLDYSNVSAGEAYLAIIRLRAPTTDESNSEETSPVFFNPGGPGGDPVESFLSGGIAPLLAAYVGNKDIIAIVPRAVGSTFPPAGCYLDEESRTARARNIGYDTEPGYVNASLNIMEANAVGFGIDCANVSADVLPYMGTVSTVKDMNHVLEALGQEKIAFLGISYGSVLGATFAVLFPDKVERMVLDGIVDSNAWFANEMDPESWVGDTDAALNNFFTSCFAAGLEICPIWAPGGPSDIRAYFFEADKRIQQKPINLPQGGLFEYPSWRWIVFRALYQPTPLFENLAKLTAEVYERTAGEFIPAALDLLLESTNPKDPPLIDPTSGLSNGIESIFGIMCLDRGLLNSANATEDPKLIFESFRAVSEVGRNSAIFNIICKEFPIRSKENLPGRFESIYTENPILFVGQTADPVTPLRNALSMAKAFPDSSVLVVNGTGHTTYGADTSFECIRTFIAPYFVDGSLPPNGTICQGDEQPFDPAGA